jgi:hypothetical protein
MSGASAAVPVSGQLGRADTQEDRETGTERSAKSAWQMSKFQGCMFFLIAYIAMQQNKSEGSFLTTHPGLGFRKYLRR